jgi:hypothetical protein
MIAQSVADILGHHVKLAVEGIDASSRSPVAAADRGGQLEPSLVVLDPALPGFGHLNRSPQSCRYEGLCTRRTILLLSRVVISSE